MIFCPFTNRYCVEYAKILWPSGPDHISSGTMRIQILFLDAIAFPVKLSTTGKPCSTAGKPYSTVTVGKSWAEPRKAIFAPKHMTGRQEGKGAKLLHLPKACEFISIIKRWLGTGPGQSCGQVSSKETSSHCNFLLYVPFLHVLMNTLDFDCLMICSGGPGLLVLLFLLVDPLFAMDCTKYPFTMACRYQKHGYLSTEYKLWIKNNPQGRDLLGQAYPWIFCTREATRLGSLGWPEAATELTRW